MNKRDILRGFHEMDQPGIRFLLGMEDDEDEENEPARELSHCPRCGAWAHRICDACNGCGFCCTCEDD